MDKRILGSIIAILILLGVLWVFAATSASTQNTADASFVMGNRSGRFAGSGNWTSTWVSGQAGYGGNLTLNFTIYPNFNNSRQPYNITNITIHQKIAYFNITKVNNTYEPGTYHIAGQSFLQYADCEVDEQETQSVHCENKSMGGPSNISGNKTIVIMVDVHLNYTYGTLGFENATASQWDIHIFTNNSDLKITDISRAAGRNGTIETVSIGIDDLAPRISSINVTTGAYTLVGKDGDFNSTYSNSLLNNTDINVTIVVNEYNHNDIFVYYGEWNGSLKASNAGLGTNWSIAFNNASATPEKAINMSRGSACNSPEHDATQSSCWYSAVIENTNGVNFSDGSTYTLMFWTNDSFNHEVNFTNGGSGFNFTIDGDDPVVTITMPTVTNIYSGRSIKIKCAASDSDGTPQLGIVTITDPSGREVSKTVEQGTYEAEFSGLSETGKTGLYKAKCTVSDIVGHIAVSSESEFRVLSSGGGAAPGEAPVAKVDISTTETPTEGISGIEGESETFTTDGVTAHRITFIEIGTDYAKMKVESTPVEFTLNIGESEEIDLDGDGVNDIKVTLSSIVEGKASVSVTNIEKYEEKLEEERKAREGPSEGKGWKLWITLLIIAVLIIVGYFVLKARSKKGAVHFSRSDLGL